MEFEILLKIILSSLLGGLFGISREISGRGSGIRIIFLVSTGSTLFSILSLELTKISNTSDPSIIIALIIVGAALIGSSAVIRSTTFKSGLLTGTTLWTSSGIGILVGLGLYLEAFLITVLIIMILELFKLIDIKFREKSRLTSYTIKVKKRISALSDIKKLLMECGINNFEWNYEKTKSGFILELSISTSGNKDDLFTEKLMEMTDVEEVKSDNI